MTSDKGLLEILITISSISNDRRLDFGQKLQDILLEIVGFMQVKSGSIMLVKGARNLEVAASTNAGLIGKKQRLDETSPSAWVYKHKKNLYIEDISKSDRFPRRFNHYKGCSLLLVPFLDKNKVMGILSVTDKIGEDYFVKREQEALLIIAGQVISALENQRLAESLKRKKRTLQQKNLKLMQLEKLKTDFYNMLIHDLKGPISELIANLDIFSYTASDEDQEYIEAAKAACDTLYSMVFNLLDIAQLEENRLKLVHEKIDPQDLVKESLARLFGLFKLKNLTFVERSPSVKTLDFFWGDRGILLRVLQNLLTNAINYSPSNETIEVGFECLKSPEIKFFVKDNGPGVPFEYHKTIFNKYFQLDKKSDGRVHTTGLGLTFCKMAVETHRGKIGVESESQKGSRFFFTLPVKMPVRG
ncbi:MAG: GAF domain-containing sensor histidine kinase [Desulfobacterales bacterium]|uniref:histidine kinase n=1 Tax=Candidatus Desulfatibia profunda TaxID=2841695 RepID=A0A8J6NP52_9BACT|nr:GAF domain-containing sensor histidine kinase [Candidatus Desulfatibia profunda]MBL7180757.1 GAF domain-containing sensor histidine kinase [Desulfobacterales bacterium]